MSQPMSAFQKILLHRVPPVSKNFHSFVFVHLYGERVSQTAKATPSWTHLKTKDAQNQSTLSSSTAIAPQFKKHTPHLFIQETPLHSSSVSPYCRSKKEKNSLINSHVIIKKVVLPHEENLIFSINLPTKATKYPSLLKY
ncbi:hypothetical protein ACH5RR_031720 [Cinchona calisaya]|uniref:Uncharacterized protein n=1 Tax=Cinchona calisaya TaxID=153742 RepID=A0ABD2YG16_9GENT